MTGTNLRTGRSGVFPSCVACDLEMMEKAGVGGSELMNNWNTSEQNWTHGTHSLLLCWHQLKLRITKGMTY